MFERDRLQSMSSRLGAVVDRGWDGRLSFSPSPLPTPPSLSNIFAGRGAGGG